CDHIGMTPKHEELFPINQPPPSDGAITLPSFCLAPYVADSLHSSEPASLTPPFLIALVA
ncbi:hypothetical protein M405DRAFT_830032, partial [Rhizopogon salebrosus TDB-379]